MTQVSALKPIGSEASRVLLECLLQNPALNIPAEVKKRFSSVVFTPKDALPVAPTPCKLSESSAGLWSLDWLFTPINSEERYELSPQEVIVDVNVATLFTMSCFILEIDGKGIWHPDVKAKMDDMELGKFTEPYRGLATNIYKTSDEQYFMLHGGLDTTRTLRMLDLPQHRHDLKSSDAEKIKDIYAEAVAGHDANWLDIEANEYWRQAGTICWKPEDFLKTPHGKSCSKEPLYDIKVVHDKIPPAPWPKASDERNRPLTGIRVLDLTRVVAGPTISKILALAGADVLRISSKNVPEPSSLIIDMQIGKRDCHINLKTEEGRSTFRKLVEDADVIVDGYRPGSLEKLGFGKVMIHEIARRRGKGIVYARENCYGWTGEWKHRSGWQQISDCVTGVSWAQGRFLGLNEPVIPLLPNSDYQTGIIGAIGILQALRMRAISGGSYNVETSLNAFNLWYMGLGLYSPEASKAIMDMHPDFKPRHRTDTFAIFEWTRRTCKNATGEGKGQLFDPANFTTGEIRWGKSGECATYLDWTRLLTFMNAENPQNSVESKGRIRMGYNTGSCRPGSDDPKWW